MTLDLGGSTLLQVQNSTLDTLIENGGVIRAGGGRILITSTAANTLQQSVINHRGVIEAESLGIGADGSVVLYATGGTLNNSGSIKAQGGFVETSGKQYNNLAGATVEAAEWLIDPVNIEINATMAASIQTALGSGNVTVTTAGAGSCAPASCTGAGTQGDITVSAAISWTANRLTLRADRNIQVNAALTASGSGSLSLLVGQATATGSSGTWNVSNTGSMIVPTPTAFTWRKGSSGTLNNLIFANGSMRFGDGTEAAFTDDGLLKQPSICLTSSCASSGWLKMTYSDYPMDFAIGAGGSGTGWNTSGMGFPRDSRHRDKV